MFLFHLFSSSCYQWCGGNDIFRKFFSVIKCGKRGLCCMYSTNMQLTWAFQNRICCFDSPRTLRQTLTDSNQKSCPDIMYTLQWSTANQNICQNISCLHTNTHACTSVLVKTITTPNSNPLNVTWTCSNFNPKTKL